jgi:hypothetical protein
MRAPSNQPMGRTKYEKSNRLSSFRLHPSAFILPPSSWYVILELIAIVEIKLFRRFELLFEVIFSTDRLR